MAQINRAHSLQMLASRPSIPLPKPGLRPASGQFSPRCPVAAAPPPRLPTRLYMMRLSLLSGALLALSAFHAAPTLAQKARPAAAPPAPPTLPAVRQVRFRADTFNIQKYGAVVDGQALNTQAFQQAVTACSRAGGGTVLVPAGLWLTGPIVLQNNVNLHLATGALVQFTADHRQYSPKKREIEQVVIRAEEAVQSRPALAQSRKPQAKSQRSQRKARGPEPAPPLPQQQQNRQRQVKAFLRRERPALRQPHVLERAREAAQQAFAQKD
jgi:hypothetical protein